MSRLLTRAFKLPSALIIFLDSGKYKGNGAILVRLLLREYSIGKFPSIEQKFNQILFEKKKADEAKAAKALKIQQERDEALCQQQSQTTQKLET